MSECIRVRAGVAILHAGRILLVPHYDTDAGPVQWVLPGGQVRYGEELAAAASRETAEETGLLVRISSLLDVSQVIRPDPPYHSLSVTFLGEPAGGELRAEAGHAHGTKTPRWFQLAELRGLPVHPPSAVAKALELLPPADPISHTPADYSCPFCALLRGTPEPGKPSSMDEIVYQDETLTALMGSHQWPRNPGNTLILPNHHYENIYELPPELGSPIQRLAGRLARAMKQAWACDGVSTRQHNEPAGNQDVWHYHLHVTPRFQGDGFYRSERQLMPLAERLRLAAELRAAL